MLIASLSLTTYSQIKTTISFLLTDNYKPQEIMKFTTPILALATLAVAAPSSIPLQSRSIDASINFFTRYDCTNPCVENGMCLAGQTGEGFSALSDDDWVGWDSGCWDFPEGTHSLALSVNNGHKFTGIDKSCAAWKKSGIQANSWTMRVGSYPDDKCNTFNHGKIKAVYYHW